MIPDPISWSRLRNIARSPLHYKYALTVQRADTPTLKLGRAVHCAVLEPQQYAARYAVYALRRAGGAWDDWLAERPGVDALSWEESERVNGMSASVRSTALQS